MVSTSENRCGCTWLTVTRQWYAAHFISTPWCRHPESCTCKENMVKIIHAGFAGVGWMHESKPVWEVGTNILNPTHFLNNIRHQKRLFITCLLGVISWAPARWAVHKNRNWYRNCRQFTNNCPISVIFLFLFLLLRMRPIRKWPKTKPICDCPPYQINPKKVFFSYISHTEKADLLSVFSELSIPLHFVLDPPLGRHRTDSGSLGACF